MTGHASGGRFISLKDLANEKVQGAPHKSLISNKECRELKFPYENK